MQITKNKVATFDFVVTDENGDVMDSSAHSGAFPYIHGIGYLVPGLEKVMEGRTVGERFSATIPPADAYGERDESLMMKVPMEKFQGIDELELGTQIQVGFEDGTQIMTVTDIEENQVTLDGNHPLAGKTLNFDVSIVDIRDATPEELEHGHPFIEGMDSCGCHHDSHGYHGDHHDSGNGCDCGCSGC